MQRHLAEIIRETIFSEKPVPENDRIRSVIYARVSTDNEGQKESCANQVEMAEHFIRQHPNITLTGEYVDDGISGKNAIDRPEFTRMIKAVEKGEVDLIIVKSMSRLHRDEESALWLQGVMLDNDCTIYTLEDNTVQDFEDANGMLIRSVKNAMDAHYVQDLSNKQRMYQDERCRKGILSAKDVCYGYSWDKGSKTISINSEEAAVVVRIFEDYTYHAMNPKDIARELKEQGIRTQRGGNGVKSNEAGFSSATVSKILQNPKYIGRFYINKRTTKLRTGLKAKSTRVKLPREEWVSVERPDLAIVDRDLFDMAQRLRDYRQNGPKPDKATVQEHFKGTHDFAAKVFCAECGRSFQFGYSDRAKMQPFYRIKKQDGCQNTEHHRISEEALLEITRKAIQEAFESKKEVFERVRETLLLSLQDTDSKEDEIRQIDRRISGLTSDIERWSDSLSDDAVKNVKAAKESLLGKIQRADEERNRLSAEKEKIENQKKNPESIREAIVRYDKALDKIRKVDTLDRKKILNYVDYILIGKDGNIKVVLKA